MNVIREEAEESSEKDDNLSLQAQVLRLAAESGAKKHKHGLNEEKISLFWRVFGGTIISIVALFALTFFNNMTNAISDLRADLTRANEARTSAVVELHNELTRANDSRGDLIRKDEFNNRLTSVWTRMQAAEKLDADQIATLTAAKAELTETKERLAKHTADLEVLHKEMSMGLEKMKRDQGDFIDSTKKEMALSAVMKERLANLIADLKEVREDCQRVRQEVDKSVAAGSERKLLRDVQSKSHEETMKELQRALQECREKIARIEGQVGSPAVLPPFEKKTIPSKTPSVVPAGGSQ